MDHVEASLLTGCSCYDKDESPTACPALFTAGELIDIRLARSKMTFAEEKEDRNTTITRVVTQSQTEKRIRVEVAKRSLCLEGWITVLGLPRSSGKLVVIVITLQAMCSHMLKLFSVWRTVGEVRKGMTPGSVGRPHQAATPNMNVRRVQRHMFLRTWLDKVWGETNAEPDPTGRDYAKVLPIFSRPAAYQQYCEYHASTAHRALDKAPLSYKVFLRQLTSWMAEERIAERQKKNVTGKCDSK